MIQIDDIRRTWEDYVNTEAKPANWQITYQLGEGNPNRTIERKQQVFKDFYQKIGLEYLEKYHPDFVEGFHELAAKNEGGLADADAVAQL